MSKAHATPLPPLAARVMVVATPSLDSRTPARRVLDTVSFDERLSA